MTSSDPLAARLESMQFELGEGPHWDALRSGRPALHNDLGTEATLSAWPVFGPAAWHEGARALYSFPLYLGPLAVGVIDLYSSEAGEPWHEALVGKGLELASAAAAPAVELATRSAASETPLNAVVAEMRREVHQASGMVLVQLDTSVEIAMSRLRAFAFASGKSLDTVAADVVAGRLDFSELGDHYTA
ncbi:MAG: GAF and ANTAR domain-containing protein [Acidobacteria bacterium]|nr:GAF and ANTAR domain-containing protein [Acidobacteriota bacterium]